MKAFGLALLVFSTIAMTESRATPIRVTAPSASEKPVPAVVNTKQPIFNVTEWRKHPGGPLTEPYFLQSQLYEMEIELVEIPKTREKVEAFMRIFDKAGNLLTASEIEIKLRGFTSLNFLKKQYGISLVNKRGKSKEASLLGMPAAEDWVLSAPFNDKSLVRDILAYNVSNKIGRHAPRTRIVSVTMLVEGQEPERMGIYVLTEKNDIGPGRIPIPKKDKDGNTAFVAAFDHPQDGDNIVWSGRETDVILDYPKAEKLSVEQHEEFMAKFNAVEERVTSPWGEAWDTIFDDLLDLDTAVDFFLVQEFARNIDAYRLSSIFYIPPKGKVHFGPVWDFNIAFGNATHENGVQYHGWRALEKGVWFGALFHHPEFCKAVKYRWIMARWDGSLSNDTVFNIIDKQKGVMSPIAAENFAKWPSLGKYLWPNPYWLATWDEEVDALKSWISLRTQWMDHEIRNMNCRGDPSY